MMRKWLCVAMGLGVCFLGGCDDKADPPEQAGGPSPDARNRAVSDDRFVPDDQPSALSNEPLIITEDPTFLPDEPTTPVYEPLPPIETPVDAADGPSVPVEEPTVSADEPAAPADVPLSPVLQLTMTTIDGRDRPLADYQGKVLLIVNTASQCGFTGQYAGLQALHEQFADSGLAVLGFPANNFGGQEPGSDGEIATFCRANFGVSFDMFSKISVAGDDRHPLYDLLTAVNAPPVGARPVGWNFEKFLIARDGTVVGHYLSNVAPGDPVLQQAIQRELAK